MEAFSFALMYKGLSNEALIEIIESTDYEQNALEAAQQELECRALTSWEIEGLKMRYLSVQLQQFEKGSNAVDKRLIQHSKNFVEALNPLLKKL